MDPALSFIVVVEQDFEPQIGKRGMQQVSVRGPEDDAARHEVLELRFFVHYYRLCSAFVLLRFVEHAHKTQIALRRFAPRFHAQIAASLAKPGARSGLETPLPWKQACIGPVRKNRHGDVEVSGPQA